MKLPKEITLNNITAIISVVVFLFGLTSGILYMKWTGEKNTQQIIDTKKNVEELSETLSDRIKTNDQRSEAQSNKISEISEDMAVVKSQVGDIKASQGAQIIQMQQIQNSFSNLANAIMQDKMAKTYDPTYRHAVYADP